VVPAGFLVLGPIIVALMAILFDIPVWAGCSRCRCRW
jgi:hypothetical protein